MPMLIPNRHLRSIVDGDGAIILDIRKDAVVTLNSTAAYIWERLQQGKLVEEIITDLSRDTGVDFAVAERDVDRFLERLKKRGVLIDTETNHSAATCLSF